MAIPFRPAIGTDAQIQMQEPSKGYVWFATDTKKIYYSDGESFLSMGGNSSIFYGIMDLLDEPAEGQTEFQFTLFDIEGNNEVTDGNYIIPNKNDLILNMGNIKPDGCFYRVMEVEGEGESIIIHTTKLTIAGSGGPSTGPSNVGSFTLKSITNKQINSLYGQDCYLEFLATAVDSEGNNTGPGRYSVTINGKPNVITGVAQNGKNTSVNVGQYLVLPSTDDDVNKINIYVTMDTGGSDVVTKRLSWEIKTTSVELTWEYDETFPNSTNSVFNLEWEVSGGSLERTTYIIIDDSIHLPPITQNHKDFTLTISDLSEYHLTHGVHKFEMWATIKLDENDEKPTQRIIKNIIFYTMGNETPIISCNFFEQTLTQYNTVEIPVIFYKYGNTGNLTATLKENGVEADKWENIINGEVRKWYYTPLETTTRNLTISCGSSEKTLIFEVESLDIDNAEVLGYAFRFKASDFASNNAIQNWNSNNITAEFSENFDWINGGLKSEKDENGYTRQYLKIKAGSYMTINYNLFEMNAPTMGKVFKFIFRAESCRDYDAMVLDCFDQNRNIGLKMQAQQALIKGSQSQITVPYCENSYIEFEFDITKTDNVRRYLTAWLDGVPTVFVQYSKTENFINNKNIVIGSPDCDVCIYMIKAYEKHLKDDEHLENFIADSLNAKEMLDRFNRNDIMDKNRGAISPTRLAEKNPNCLVHVYDIDHMVKEVDVVVPGCSYTQYHGSKDPVLFADNVDIKIQGTSSARYGLSAFNIDSSFNDGFIYPDGTAIDKWSMNENSIPVNYFTTKVNVASAEHANNALNADWYNKFQPYKTGVRKKDPRARDCMEFTPGVLFLKDRNTQAIFDDNTKFISNNVFAEISNYINDPYARMYSICNMGNSKKNTEVFHDQTNPLEYCIEVSDNQKPTQWMINNIYDDSHWTVEKPDWEFRYPKYKNLENTSNSFISPLTNEPVSHRQHAFDSWRRFINWMATSNPQPKYKKLILKSIEEFEKASIKIVPSGQEGVPDTIIHIDLYVAPEDQDGNLIGGYSLITEYDESIQNYYTLTDSLYGYTMEPLIEPQHFTADDLTFKHEEYSKNILGLTMVKYVGTYYYDTYEYRMAKMIKECEDYLVMDSVLFHYLFIERHTMIDNVAKNTFWSTEDGFHWNLTKNYDNDTSDGNDNQGKLTLTYGIEPFDNVPGKTDDFYFNANQSVWFRFCGGLYEACKKLHKALQNAGENKKENAWDSVAYLKRFKEWQKTIPERCWIEDYYRKYVRPLEIYNESMYVSMLEGGQKTHQRQQYETYQDNYISSKYASNTENSIIIRGNGDKLYMGVPLSVYADCYVQAAFGGGNTPNLSLRVKRNEPVIIKLPEDLGTIDNATIYFFSPHLYQEFGKIGGVDLSVWEPEQMTVGSAVKLRTFVAGQYDVNPIENNTLISVGFENNIMLEDLYMANYPSAKLTLDLTSSVNLKTLDLRNSGFTGIIVADGAPVNSIQLCEPNSITLSNLRNLNVFTIQKPQMVQELIINNIDNNSVNSKNIVNLCPNLSFYTLKNVKWNIDDASEIANKKINILEKILLMTPVTPQEQLITETSETSLTGSLIISDTAYNNNDALDIYNYYSVDIIRTENVDGIMKDRRRFPNLDFIFQGENSKLYNITILKNENDVIWKRKLRPGDNVDELFLSNGPLGALNLKDIEKSSTEYFDYSFTGKWKIYNTDTGKEITSISTENKLPLLNKVNANLTFVPIFEETQRLWSVTLKQDDQLLGEFKDIPAGTLLKDIIASEYPQIPYKSDENLDTYITYSFEGYAFSRSATAGIKLDNYPLTSNIILYAIFKEVSVYNNIHEDYWDYDLVSSKAYSSTLDNVVEYQIEAGYVIKPNSKKELRGKVTIPATYNGLPVYKINNGAFKNNIDITHIFFEPGAKMRVIGEGAFENSYIKFFEFTSELRRIESSAFSKAKQLLPNSMNNYIFGENLYYLGDMAFNQALNFNGNAVTFLLPSTLKTMGSYALSNFAHPTVNSSIMIGQPGDFSDLDLSVAPGYTSTDRPYYRRISDGTKSLIAEVLFYSKIYNNVDEMVTVTSIGKTYSVGQMLGNDSGGINNVEVIHK